MSFQFFYGLYEDACRPINTQQRDNSTPPQHAITLMERK